MDTLSVQLTKLYENRWYDFMAQLKAAALDKSLQDPLLISLALSGQEKPERERMQREMGYDAWYAKKSTAEHEDWYSKADVKVMFFGKEANGWARGCDVGELMEAYEDFLDDHYNAAEGKAETGQPLHALGHQWHNERHKGHVASISRQAGCNDMERNIKAFRPQW